VRVNHADKTVHQTSLQFAGLAELDELYRRELRLTAHQLIIEFGNVQVKADQQLRRSVKGLVAAACSTS
jgi:hypothetical protein